MDTVALPAAGGPNAVLEWVADAVPGTALFRASADGVLVAVSSGWTATTGLEVETSVGHRIVNLVHPDDRLPLERLLARRVGGASPAAEVRVPGPGGDLRHVVAMRGPDLAGPDSRDVIGLVRDMSAGKAIERQLAAAYSYDTLTALPNRTLFMDRLAETVRRSRAGGGGVALIVCDIDRFRAVNDTAGNRTANELLRIVARRLGRQVRGGDMVGRIGADEFAVIQTGVNSREEVQSLVERLAFVLSKPYRADSIRLRASCSFGVAMFPGESDDAETLLRDAQTALDEAKRIGRGQIRFFDPAVDGLQREQHSLENDLIQAIEEAGLTLHFQPVVDLATGRILGAEALLRWPHPERGYVAPASFVPVAEATGAIRPLGAWVLEEACAALKRWDEAGLSGLTVAVNVSAVQFHDGGVYEAVTAALDRSGIEPHRLEIEITETATLHGTAEEAQPQLAALARRGVQVVIDDFGMGYGALTYLRTFPISKIKIDRAFVAAVADEPRDAAIVRGVAALGTSLGLRVQPEGIETEAQLGFLKDLGCTEAQGYLFSRPLPDDAFVAFVRDWEQRRAAAGQRLPEQGDPPGDIGDLLCLLASGADVSAEVEMETPAAGSTLPSRADEPWVPKAAGWERAVVVGGSLAGLWAAIGAVFWMLV